MKKHLPLSILFFISSLTFTQEPKPPTTNPNEQIRALFAQELGAAQANNEANMKRLLEDQTRAIKRTIFRRRLVNILLPFISAGATLYLCRKQPKLVTAAIDSLQQHAALGHGMLWRKFQKYETTSKQTTEDNIEEAFSDKKS